MKTLLLALFVALLMAGCETAKLGRIDLDDPETLEKIIVEVIAEAISEGRFFQKGGEGEILFYAPNQQKPYTGWLKGSYGNGQTMGLAQYKAGKLDGLVMRWYANGQKKWGITYKNGKLMTAVTWKPNGEMCPVTNVVIGHRVWVAYNDDGMESFRFTYKDGEVGDGSGGDGLPAGREDEEGEKRN